MSWAELIIYIVLGLLVLVIGFICIVAWLIDEGFKSKYREEQEALKKIDSESR
jgi:cbb3-type cytochrome oxidase subunit 3